MKTGAGSPTLACGGRACSAGPTGCATTVWPSGPFVRRRVRRHHVRRHRERITELACTCRPRHSVLCILPPHLLHEVAKRGDKRQREAALATLSLDATHRTRRATLAAGLAPVPQAAATEPVKNRSVHDAKHQESSSGKLVRSEGAGPVGDV